MKKLISLLTASALMLGLSACGDFAPDPTASQETALDFEYTEESFPEVWAGRSAAPLMEAVAAIMLGTGRAEGAERISFAATDEVWGRAGARRGRARRRARGLGNALGDRRGAHLPRRAGLLRRRGRRRGPELRGA